MADPHVISALAVKRARIDGKNKMRRNVSYAQLVDKLVEIGVVDSELLQCSWRSWFLCTVGRNGVTVLRVPKNAVLRQDELCAEPFRTALVHSQRAASDDGSHYGQ